MSNNSQPPKPRRTYRSLIVGGGSTGCLLAYLLARRGYGPVALIEAGPRSSDVRTRVPNWYPRLFGSRLDWQFDTVPQTGMHARRLRWPRGKLLGGSGAINALIYLEPATADLQRWGWKEWYVPASLEQLADRCETTELHAWSEKFLEAAVASGMTRTRCLSQARGDLCGAFIRTQQQASRFHTGLLLNQPLAGLEIICDSTVERLHWEAEEIVGVTVRTASGDRETIYAEEEIILCGGALGSPLLLLQSGIGPSEHLTALDIPCRHPLKQVGANLQDHLTFPLIYRASAASGLARRPSYGERQLYRAQGRGPLASNIAEAGALKGASGTGSVLPAYQIHFTPTHYLRYPRQATEDCFFSLGITDLHPISRGSIRLRRDGEQLLPLIDPGYFRESQDLSRMLEALQWARDIAGCEPLRGLACEELLPSPRRADARALGKSIRAFAQSIYHPVGTCRMDSSLASGPEETVVDSQFRVHGLHGLRIADASVLPDLPSCNTNSICWHLAARLADLLIGPDM